MSDENIAVCEPGTLIVTGPFLARAGGKNALITPQNESDLVFLDCAEVGGLLLNGAVIQKNQISAYAMKQRVSTITRVSFVFRVRL